MRAFSYPRTRSKSTARFRLAASDACAVAYLELPVDLVANPYELVGFLEEPDEALEAVDAAHPTQDGIDTLTRLSGSSPHASRST